MDKTLPILMMLPDVELVKLCQAQSWWIPQLYPIVFPGNMRMGQAGMPPIFKECTADKRSKRLLIHLIELEGRAQLPRNVVIVHEDGSRSFIPEAMLTPLPQFNTEVLPENFSVSVGDHQSSSSSDQSPVSDQDDDDAPGLIVEDGGDNNDDNPDDAVAMANPTRPSSQHSHLVLLQNEPRFFPGQDGYGSLHKLQKTVSAFRFPWTMTPREIEVYCRITKMQFFDFVQSNVGVSVRGSGLNLYAQSLLFKIRLCHEITWDELASQFNVSRNTASNVFIRVLLHQYVHHNNIPNILNLNGDLVASERDKLLETADNNCPIYFKQLVRDLRDPSGRNRKPVIINCDSTYLDTQSSKDIGKNIFIFDIFKKVMWFFFSIHERVFLPPSERARD